MSSGHADNAIAIVGMACRMPGAADVAAFWANLRAGIASFSRFSDEDLRASGVDPAVMASPHYVRSRGIIDGADAFDAAFFGINPREAELIDPQQRVFLECAWHALEDAGYVPGEGEARVGVFGGVGTNWHLGQTAASPVARKYASGASVVISNDKDYVTTRVSYKLGLTGPSVNVQTACSTSLVAALLGVASLRAHQADMVLAGGATIEIPERKGYLHQEGGMESPDGQCRPFDAAANGTVFSRGAGVVVLKRLADALRDRDHVYAVILDGAVNNDGAAKMGFTAPSVAGQLELTVEALERAGLSADAIDFVEAHGTATPLGDPIEVEALTQAFRHYTDRSGYCALGSVKGNIGHTDVASGVAGLIKAAKAIEERVLPASLNYAAPNPKIDFSDSPLFVNTQLRPLRAGGPVRGLLSSFGVGGTNASVVLESAPPPPPARGPEPNVALLSARSEAALDRQAERLRAHVEANPGLDLARMAYTLQAGRKPFRMRRALPFAGRDDLLAALAAPVGANRVTCERDGAPLAFLFPGQGNQYLGMGRALYRRYPVFRDALDRAAEILEPILGLDLRAVLFAEGPEAERAAALIDRTHVTQPALFAIGHAQAMLWQSWGLAPDALVGHSVGEYVAACLAGVFTFEEGLQLVAARGALIQSMPGGSMLAVLLPEERLAGRLPDGVEVAAVNSQQMTVVAGPDAAIAAFEARLAAEKVVSRHLRTSHAFHSAMMEPAIPRFSAMFEGIRLHPPRIPIVSTLTGRWLSDAEATDPGYWARHMRAAVRFADAAEVLTGAAEPYVFLECGPGHSLASSIKAGLDRAAHHRVLGSQPAALDGDRTLDDAMSTLMRAVGGLWAAGCRIDWEAFYGGDVPGRAPLPGYPFERQRYALDFSLAEAQAGPPRDGRKAVGDWFYEPGWVRTLAPSLLRRAEAEAGSRCWLLFDEADGVADALAADLRSAGHAVVRVRRGAAFGSSGDAFTLRPGLRADYDALLAALRAEDVRPTRIVHLWNLGDGAGFDDAALVRTLAFDSPLFLEQALIAQGTRDPVRLLIVTSGVYGVAGEPVTAPLRALAAGPARVIAKEYPAIQARLVDVRGVPELARRLAEEAELDLDDTVVAYRGRSRFAEHPLPVPLEPAAGLDRRIRDGGTYLVTGGLGALGLFFAQAFVAAAQVNLVLVHRSDLPERADWDRDDLDPEMAERIAALRQLEAAGATVMLARADVADAAAMASVVARAEERFGAIHGVVHSAGSAGGGIIALKSPEMAAPVLDPKVAGTRVLDALFRDRPLDFFLLFSSVTAVLGEAGRVDYCAANAYLDALAQQWALARPGVMRSIGWSAWTEIGMASRWEQAKARRRRAALVPKRSAPDAWLQPIASEAGSEILEVMVDAETDWIVADHRVFGVPTLVGAAFIEFVHRYARLKLDGATVQIVSAYFVAPMMVPPGEPRRLQLAVTEGAAGRRFAFRSQPAADPAAAWQDHFVGELATGPVEPADRDLAALRADFGPGEDPPPAELGWSTEDGRPLLSFGRRWDNVVSVAHSGTAWLSELRLPPDFADDDAAFAFHPALVDIALASGRFQMARAAAVQGVADGHYLPLGYRRLALLKPLPKLPAPVWSHVRLVGEHRPGAETITFDVTLLDAGGEPCLDVAGYTLKKVDPGASATRPTAPRVRPAAADEDIQRAEGLDALQRLLAAPFVPHLVVTTKDLAWQIEDGSPTAKARAVRAQLSASEEERADPGRGTLQTTYEAPDNEVERAIAEIWQGILGIRRIGVADDFMELGGNSLLAVQMMTVTGETFRVPLSIEVFFRAPTVRGLAEAVVEHLIALADPDVLDELVSDLER